jgi:hypothetical protein
MKRPTQNSGRNSGNLRPWRKGQSGNPGGRPRYAPEHRARCRELAELALEKLAERLVAGELANHELLAAYEALADRGGFLAADRIATVQASMWRTCEAILSMSTVPNDERRRLIVVAAEGIRDLLAEPPPTPPPTEGKP